MLYLNFEKYLYNDVDRFLEARAISISDSIDTLWEKEKATKVSEGFSERNINNIIKRYFFKIIKSWISKNEGEDPNLLNLIIQIFDDKGEMISSSKKIPEMMKFSKNLSEFTEAKKFYYENKSLENPKGKYINIRFLITPIYVEEKISYIVRVGISLRTTESALNYLRIILFFLLPFTILFTGVISVFFTNITLKPINKMMDTINLITAGNLKLRIDIPESKDEVRRLADTFNGMLHRLDKAFSSQQKLIEDLSHELKTPLAIIKGEIEVGLKRNRTHDEYIQILESNLEESNRIIKIVENLLLISRFENELVEFDSKIINLNALATGIINDMNVLANQKNISIKSNFDKNIFIIGDENQIKILFINLIDNSIKYTNNDGFININMKKNANDVLIEIIDTGIGINENELPYIFDRYYRAIKLHKIKGFGLGLSIARSIVETHKGKIEVKSIINNGTTFIITFPLYTKKTKSH
ncbi:MAG TPA: ATP-binding protein [Spirochaetota bacterium]|nr:ATP-binding protein [Spirochaetota bacterium]